MKKSCLFIGLVVLAASNISFAQPQPAPVQGQDQQRLQMAKEGCQKPIGYLPTPAKIMCVLTALGVSENEVKSKSLALIFNVCHGRLLQTAPAGVTPKAYNTLGDCLSDPTAISLINKELVPQGFPEIKVTNPSVLNAPKTP